MWKNIIQYLFRKPDEIGFDNYMVNLLCFLIAMMGLMGTIINLVAGLGWFTTLSTLLVTLLFWGLYLFSRFRQKYIISKYLLTLLSFILINFEWFINYGSWGPIIYLFVILESFILIFFVKWEKVIFTSLLFLDVTVLFLIEYLYPESAGRYPSDSARLIDLYSSMIIYMLLGIALLNIALKFYIHQQEKAQLADKLKSAFLANMSHEIRTPMNGILGFAELLKKPGLSGEEQQSYIDIIEKSGARMLNIINNLIDISRIESGIMDVDWGESNINEQLEFIHTFFQPEIEQKGLEFSIHTGLPPHKAVITTDREKVYAILTNLVKNAIKFTNHGSIHFGYVKKGRFLEFYVRDTGIGIPKDRQSAIFERFIQADLNDQMAHQGAGLGLSITRSYVEMLGGKIWVVSSEGNGSAFYFTIPYNYESDIPDEAVPGIMPADHQQDSGKLIILIAEDDPASEILVSIALEPLAKEIIKVHSGVEAIDVCRARPDIDLVLMDIKMPVMGGYEATQRIREFNSKLIIVAQTAYGLSGDREKALDAGCNDYISKPIHLATLEAIISRHLGMKN